MAHRQWSSHHPFPRLPRRLQTTLLELVWAVGQVTSDDQLVAATVAHLVNSGRARLTGTFNNVRLIVG
jgi:hypothetical protein